MPSAATAAPEPASIDLRDNFCMAPPSADRRPSKLADPSASAGATTNAAASRSLTAASAPARPAVQSRGLGGDVLVVAEEVVGVVGALDVDQAVVVALVVVLDALLIVAGHEVDVAAGF